MGKTQINEYIGLKEDIGPIANLNQATCTSDGCKKIKKKCVRGSQEITKYQST
jgi:hypothetical protein